MTRCFLLAASASLAMLWSHAGAAEADRVFRSLSDADYALPADEVSIGVELCDAMCDVGYSSKDSCDVKGSSAGCCYLFGPPDAWTVVPESNRLGLSAGGWVTAGYHNETTPLSTQRGDLLSFNDVPDGFNAHQAWVFIEKALNSDAGCLDWGFRADFMYGTDAQKTQAFGGTGWDNTWDNGVYGWALPQLYFEIGTGDLSVKGGHFFTLIGYEVVGITGNFFYSHALTMFNSEPFTHSGVLVTYGVCDNLETYAGWTAGMGYRIQSNNGGTNFLGGFSYSMTDNLTLTYITTAGDFGARGGEAYSHSIVCDLAISDRLNYVFQQDLLSVKETSEETIGINQYVFYTLNDCVKLGSRIEWWKADGLDRFELTGGVNIRPHANFVVRPEIRYDWSNDLDTDQTTFGMDAIVTF